MPSLLLTIDKILQNVSVIIIKMLWGNIRCDQILSKVMAVPPLKLPWMIAVCLPTNNLWILSRKRISNGDKSDYKIDRMRLLGMLIIVFRPWYMRVISINFYIVVLIAFFWTFYRKLLNLMLMFEKRWFHWYLFSFSIVRDHNMCAQISGRLYALAVVEYSKYLQPFWFQWCRNELALWIVE